MQGLREAVLAVSLLLGVAGFGTAAHAQGQDSADDSDTRARELFENGARLYDEGLYEDAIAAWQAAHDLSKKPLLLFNIANALERIGKYQQALDHLNQYRALAPSSERETLERRMRNIERRIEEEKANGPGDPIEAASAPVEVKSTGTSGSVSGPHPAGIVLVIGGAAGLAVGGVLSGLALRERAAASALCVDVADGDPLCPSTAKVHLDADRSYSLGGDIALAAGGVALGAGIIVLIVEASKPTSATAVRLTPSFGPHGAALSFEGRF